MKKLITYLILVLVLFSCDNLNKPKKPKNLIAKDKMTHIIIDISLFTAAKGTNRKVIEESGMSPENYVYIKYNIDSLQFASSNAYYAHNIDAYQSIYEKVKDSLDVLKKHYQIIEKETLEKKRIEDSINRMKKKDSLLKNIDSISPLSKRLKQLKIDRPLNIKYSNDSII